MNVIIAILFLICFEVLSYLFMLADAKMDNITFHRIHLGLHPLKDYWHLQKQLMRLYLFLLGATSMGLIIVAVLLSYWLLLIFPIWALSFIKLKKLWETIAKDPDIYYFNKDETVHITTGWTFLDNLLGFGYKNNN